MSDSILSNWFNSLPLSEYQQTWETTVSHEQPKVPVTEHLGDPKLKVSTGPLLRLVSAFENKFNNYRATILVVTKDDESDYSKNPTIRYHIGPAHRNDLKEHLLSDVISTGEFPVIKLHQEQGYSFWRFSVELDLIHYEQRIKYSLNGFINDSYQFFVPRNDQNMNVVAFSCNGFSLSTDTSTFKGSLWLDVLRNHDRKNYHVMIGGGDQLYADAIKLSSEPFSRWLKHKNLHSNMTMNEELKVSFDQFYLNHYLQWFGSGFMSGLKGSTLQTAFPTAMAQIPSICIFDDHDIIDGFGSYSDRTMSQPIFKGVGKAAFKYYVLFQHHSSIEEDLSKEPGRILGYEPGPFIDQKSISLFTRLGKDIATIGVDCRTERRLKRVITPETYKKIFLKLETEFTAAPFQHLYVQLGVPIAYPRLVWLEKLLDSKLLAPIKFLARKGIVLKSLVNEFDGSVEVLDDLNDHWCSQNHKKERNWFIEKLIDFSERHKVRITIISGDVHLCCVGRFHSRTHISHPVPSDAVKEENKNILKAPEHDSKLIFNVITSAIVNTPPPDMMATLLDKRSKVHHFDSTTDEDMVPMFTLDSNGRKRDNVHFMNRRNWCELIPVKNLNSSDYKVEDRVLPGPVANQDDGNSANASTNNIEHYTPYPVTEEGVVMFLHVEKNHEDLSGATSEYQLTIPSLT
ncbi:hypothetical protein LJB42_004159 [Komagataella kurtzmanii]|nr:hypothetical protein LJB42_004159 [Komagataella kurtzmanii]